MLQYENNRTLQGVLVQKIKGTYVKMLLCLCGGVHFLVLLRLVINRCLLIDTLRSYIDYVFQHNRTLTTAILFYSVWLKTERREHYEVLTLYLFVFLHPSGLRLLSLHPVCHFPQRHRQTIIIPACLQPLSPWLRQV